MSVNQLNIIATATIASDLHRIMLIALNVSIAAKNAMIISAQAGEQALSFQPITRFIDDVARETIANTEKVEKESIQLTRLSANYLRTLDASRRFAKVIEKAADAKNLTDFYHVNETCLRLLDEQVKILLEHIRKLSEYMQDLDQSMLAALAVASVSRIEASRAGEYSENLGVVADDLEDAVLKIRKLLDDGMSRISVINQLT